MRILLTSLMAATVMSGAALPALAQEQVTINGVEATRIVIPPAGSDLALTIKTGLRDAYYSAPVGTAEWKAAQSLYFSYAERGFEPLWLSEENGEVTFSDKAQAIVGVFEAAAYQGFDPSDYLTDAIDLDLAAGDPDGLATLETAFSEAALAYAQDAVGGRFNPRSVAFDITLRPTQIDPAETLVHLAAADDPAAYLLDMHPQHREFVGLRDQLAKYLDGTAVEQIQIPDGGLIKAGMSDERVPMLRQRLGVEAPETDELIFDEFTIAAVTEFQDSLGMTVDGIVGPATIAALNGSGNPTREDLIANMERWRWLPRSLGDFYVFVNVPEYEVEVHDGDSIAFETRVVVGQTKHRTPIFSDEIEHVVVNPYWNVPASIASNELMPSILANPGYLSSRNYELLSGGRVIPASAVDWASVNPSNPPFRIRQRPGGGNALGQIKFLFPNSHNVYLHDTPSKSLFSRAYRAYSHGCIRVMNPMDFANALLQKEPELTLARLESQFGPTEKWNNLDRHVPVYINYFTLRVNEDGSMRSYADVYGHNATMVGMIGS